MRIRNKIQGIREIWRFDNRWYLALSRVLFPREKTQIYRFRGVEVLIDHDAGDANGAREVVATDMYKKYLSRMDLRSPISVFDLGGNNGGFPLMLKAEGFDIAIAVSVELNPGTCSRLRYNLERNFESTVKAMNCAVTGTNRNVEFIPDRKGSSSNNIYNAVEDNSGLLTVRGYTFDDIYKNTFGDNIVDLCKMDVEGAEFEILREGNCDRLKMCRYLLIEIHHEPDRNRDEVLSRLHDLGFEEVDGASKSDEFHHVHFLVNIAYE